MPGHRNDQVGQIAFLGDPQFGIERQDIDFVKIAEACDAKGFRIEDPAKCGDILDEAFAAAGPVLIEAV